MMNESLSIKYIGNIRGERPQGYSGSVYLAGGGGITYYIKQRL